MQVLDHVMVDLETFGTTPGCGFVSIGAVKFDPYKGVVGSDPADVFYTVVNRDSCKAAFLFEEQGTIDWWGRQSPEARIAFDQSTRGEGMDLREALLHFAAFTGNGRGLRIWGNGADFDNALMAAAHNAVGLKMPATYGGRCYRTLKNLDELFGDSHKAPKLVRQGTHHNALDDAIDQARHLCDIVAFITGDY